MASEDPYSREGSKRSPEEDRVLKEHSFDELAIGIASGAISRGGR
jgi:hypothetical protein